jgi:hypothetical protein
LVYPEIAKVDFMRVRRLIMLGMALGLAGMPTAALACDACMGGKDPTIRPAVNGAIFFMLGTVGMMGTGVGFFMRYLSKRAKMPLPPHAEFNGL